MTPELQHEISDSQVSKVGIAFDARLPDLTQFDTMLVAARQTTVIALDVP